MNNDAKSQYIEGVYMMRNIYADICLIKTK